MLPLVVELQADDPPCLAVDGSALRCERFLWRAAGVRRFPSGKGFVAALSIEGSKAMARRPACPCGLALEHLQLLTIGATAWDQGPGADNGSHTVE